MVVKQSLGSSLRFCSHPERSGGVHMVDCEGSIKPQQTTLLYCERRWITLSSTVRLLDNSRHSKPGGCVGMPDFASCTPRKLLPGAGCVLRPTKEHELEQAKSSAPRSLQLCAIFSKIHSNGGAKELRVFPCCRFILPDLPVEGTRQMCLDAFLAKPSSSLSLLPVW